MRGTTDTGAFVGRFVALLRDGRISPSDVADAMVAAGMAAPQLARFADAVVEEVERNQDPWGPPPPEDEVDAAAARAERSRREALTQELARSLTRDQAAERLGISPQAVSDRLKAGRLVALRRGREWRFPDWQFGDDDALPGLDELAVRYPGSMLALSVWAKRSHADLQGRSPAAELARRGGTERVLALVDAVRATAW
jgi:excisionase family DNA binding protein